MKRLTLLFSFAGLAVLVQGCGMHRSALPATGQLSQALLSAQASPAAGLQKLYAVRLSVNSLDAYLLNGSRSFPSLPWAMPASGAVDANGDLFVANAGQSNSVTSYTPSGRQTTPTIGHLSGAVAVAVDQNGKIYIAQSGGRILTYKSDGTRTEPTIKGLVSPRGIAVDGAGQIFVADAGANMVRRFTPSGTQDLSITTAIDRPVSVAVGADGKIYVANARTNAKDPLGRITTYNPDGSRTTPSVAELPELVDVSVDQAGKIYATRAHQTSGSQSGIVEIYASDGTLNGQLYAATNPMGAFHAARPRASGDIVVFADNGVMAFMPNGTRTAFNISGSVFASGVDRSGNIHAAAGPPYRIETYDVRGERLSGFSLPVSPTALIGGVAFDANGDSFVTMPGIAALRAYDANGNQLFSIVPPSHSQLGSVSTHSGKVYVVDGGPSGSVTTFTLNGTRTAPTISNLAFPTAVAVDNAGHIYVGVGNAIHTTGTIRTFNADGSPSSPTINGLAPLAGLAVSSTGDIFASAGGTVTAYSSAGNALGIQFQGLNDAASISIY